MVGELLFNIFSTDNVLFTIGGGEISLLETLSVISGLSCVFLATRGKVANFWIGYLYNILLFLLFYQKGLYSSMMVQPISLVINFFGHYRWTHPREGEENSRNQLRVTLLTPKKRLYFVVQIALFTLIWGALLTKLHLLLPSLFDVAKKPFLDAFVTITILTAQYLSAQKKLECWAAWFTVNITNVTLYILAGMLFLPIVSGGYLILAIMGFTMWYRAYKENS